MLLGKEVVVELKAFEPLSSSQIGELLNYPNAPPSVSIHTAALLHEQDKIEPRMDTDKSQLWNRPPNYPVSTMNLSSLPAFIRPDTLLHPCASVFIRGSCLSDSLSRYAFRISGAKAGTGL